MGLEKIDWEREKENLEKYLQERLSYTDIAKIYELSCGAVVKNQVKKLGLDKLYNPCFKCKYCGKTFDTKQEYSGHVSACSENPKYKERLKQLEIARSRINNSGEYYCKFCGKLIHNKGCLAIHEKACELNPNREKCPNRIGNGGGYPAWNKGKTAQDDERILKAVITYRKHLEEGKFTVKGTPHTDEMKRHLREKMIEYIKLTGNGKFGQHFSIKGCEYIDKLNESRGWHLVHAMNGGEMQVCGYFLDGYDKELNIAFEYDEPKHYKSVSENILTDRDIKRQEEIIKELKCTFYRYNEKLDLFYKI